MREIEKGVLLAEFFGVDTSKYVPSFIEWIKKTEQYIIFNRKYELLRNKRSWKARRFYSYFESVALEESETIKEAMIEYGKICYLVKITSEPSYINPLIIENIDNPEMSIGDINVSFDGKIMTIRELAQIEGFTFERKDELIKEKINNWIKEVEEAILAPIEEYKTYSFYLPKIKWFSVSRTIELIYLILLNAFLAAIYVIKIPLFENILSDVMSIDFFVYLLAIGFTLVYDLIFIITMIVRRVRYGYYKKARDGVMEDIVKEKEKVEFKLRRYMYAQLATMGDMSEKISTFTKLSKYYPYIGYIRKHLILKKRIVVDKMNIAEKAALIVTLLCLIALIVIMFI